MTVVDSSVWLQYFRGGASADLVAAHLPTDEIVVPSVILYEVYKVLRRDVSEDAAVEAVAWLSEWPSAPLDDDLALQAAEASLQHALPMADAIIYATAQAYEATLVTSDQHFAGLPGVEYVDVEDTGS